MVFVLPDITVLVEISESPLSLKDEIFHPKLRTYLIVVIAEVLNEEIFSKIVMVLT